MAESIIRVRHGAPSALKRPVYAFRFKDGTDFGVIDEWEYFEDHDTKLYFFDKDGGVRLVCPFENLLVFRVLEKPADAIKASNAESLHIQKEVAGAGLKEESKVSMREAAAKEAERFVLKIEEGSRAFIIDLERPTETWKLPLEGTGGWAAELVALANKAHKADLMAAHASKVAGETQIGIRITDLESVACMRLMKTEFDKLQAQGIYKGVMAPCVQMPNGEFFRLTLEDAEKWVSLTRAFVETTVNAKPAVPPVPSEITVPSEAIASALIDRTVPSMVVQYIGSAAERERILTTIASAINV